MGAKMHKTLNNKKVRLTLVGIAYALTFGIAKPSHVIPKCCHFVMMQNFPIKRTYLVSDA